MHTRLISHILRVIGFALCFALAIYISLAYTQYGWGYPEKGPIPGVLLSGPSTGKIGINYTFTATVGPITNTIALPITYTWQATDKTPLINSGKGVSDTTTYTWNTTGLKFITVTATDTEGNSVSDTMEFIVRFYYTYLPVVQKRWPPLPSTPVLNTINIMDNDGNYTVTWNQADLATTYTLEEDDNIDFTSPTPQYTGAGTTWVVNNPASRTSYYRVRANNDWGYSNWSNKQAIFHDNFSNVNGGWGVYENSVERWRYINGRYEGTKKGEGLIIERASLLADNYTLQVEAYPVTTPGEGSYGLIFGMSEDWKQFYQFVVEPANGGYAGFYRLDKRTAGGWITLRDWTEHNVSGIHTTLKIVREGTRIEAYIDNTLVDTLYDSELTGPRRVGVAVRTYDGLEAWVTTQFDNLMLTATAENMTPVAPPVVHSITTDSIKDACVLEGYPTTNFGKTRDMWAGYDGSDMDGEIARSLVQFDVSQIPAGATIHSAVLKLFLVASWDFPNKSRTITIYRLSSSWAETGVTWKTRPSVEEAYGSASVTHSDWQWYEFDVTALVSGWVNGNWPNYGLAVRGPEYSGSDASLKSFSTREGYYLPYIDIVYTTSNTQEVTTWIETESESSTNSLTLSDFLGTRESPSGTSQISQQFEECP
ncbi:MAG: DNRLRE domain-containing protein [Anaerolineae bacterium]|nr:DNRLRE domain-containing protein [Anaerolineae bacterium]